MVGLKRGTVELEPYQESWKDFYEKEAQRLDEITDGYFQNIEHIGSTAIEDMVAKPIVDILAAVENLESSKDIIPVLENHGYEHRPDEDVSGRLFLAKGPRTNRTCYLSIAEMQSEFYREKLAFRDYLREHPKTAEEYAVLKEELASAYSDTRAEYTAQKGDFIQNILSRAMND